jgi:prevent-host-death family protein
MTQVTVHEAKTHLSRLLAAVESGEEVVICRGSKPVARLVRCAPPAARVFGGDEGTVVVHDNFNDPMPELEQYF